MEIKKKLKILNKIKNEELGGIEDIESEDFINFLDFCIENNFVSGIRYENNNCIKIFIKDLQLTSLGKDFLRELENESIKI
ncbi:MAG: hypothetical protein ACRC6K_01115 [Fusobacteriaceae bacterium]